MDSFQAKRRQLLAFTTIVASGLGWPSAGYAKIPKLVLAGPMASVSYPLIQIAESTALSGIAEQVEFVAWKDPDQLRALMLGEQAHFIAVPSNVAASLYNRGVKLRLLNISSWGMLTVVSNNKNIKSLADLEGEELLVPFRGDMPDIILNILLKKYGTKLQQGITLRYVSNPIEAMQLLLTRRASHALLAEPATSMGLNKARTLPASIIAPDLYRAINIQAEWGALLQREPQIPQAGIVVTGSNQNNTELVNAFSCAYVAALNWCNSNPDACGKIVAKHIAMLTPESVADSIKAVQGMYLSATKARPELEFFYNKLYQTQPGLIGGKLPDNNFYYQLPDSLNNICAG